MIDPVFDPNLVIAGTCLMGLAVIAFATLRGWHSWIDLKRSELGQLDHSPREIEGNASLGAARIEMADLKERIKKLEAIASGVEL
ncbi:MAG: hypothetical protein ABJP48_07430 [Erythrobacter sp.]